MLLQRLSSRKVLVNLGPDQLLGLVVLLICMIDVGTELGRVGDKTGKAKTASHWNFVSVLGEG